MGHHVNLPVQLQIASVFHEINVSHVIRGDQTLARAELCAVYRAAVLRMERNLMSESVPHMAAVQHYLSEYTFVLPGVHSIIYELSNIPNATDAQIMGLLFDRTRSGIPVLQAVVERLLFNCNMVLYKHISAWCVLFIPYCTLSVNA